MIAALALSENYTNAHMLQIGNCTSCLLFPSLKGLQTGGDRQVLIYKLVIKDMSTSILGGVEIGLVHVHPVSK